LKCCETGVFFSSLPRGPLEKEDFEQLAKEVDPFIASKGKLVGLMIHTESFPGWENFGAFVSHLKFVGYGVAAGAIVGGAIASRGYDGGHYGGYPSNSYLAVPSYGYGYGSGYCPPYGGYAAARYYGW
jgi:hypothetical protein